MYCGSLGFFFFLKVMALLSSGIRWKEDSVLCVHEEVEMLLIPLIRILNYLKCIAAVMWILTHSLEESFFFFSVCTWPEVGWETSKQPDCQKRESHWCPVEPKDGNKCCVIGQNSKLLVIGHGSCVCSVCSCFVNVDSSAEFEHLWSTVIHIVDQALQTQCLQCG